MEAYSILTLHHLLDYKNLMFLNDAKMHQKFVSLIFSCTVNYYFLEMYHNTIDGDDWTLSLSWFSTILKWMSSRVKYYDKQLASSQQLLYCCCWPCVNEWAAAAFTGVGAQELYIAMCCELYQNAIITPFFSTCRINGSQFRRAEVYINLGLENHWPEINAQTSEIGHSRKVLYFFSFFLP